MTKNQISNTLAALVSAVAICLLPAFSWAESKLELSNNRVLVYETSDLDQPGPVFIFMPGIFRGLSMNEDTSKLPEEQRIPFTQLLKDKKIPFVLMNFAEQPASVAATGSARPDFSHTTADVLADEVLALAQHLNLKQAIPVSLSFSGAVVAHLNKTVFPAVVETAPISTDTDTLPPAVVSSFEIWKSMMQMYPFWGPMWVEQAKQTSLRQYWGPIVDGYAKPLPVLQQSEYRERAIQGYMGLSAASEGFDIRKQDFAAGPARIFIFGEQEEPIRLARQKEAAALYEKAWNISGASLIIPQAGHMVPIDQPKAYVEVLAKIFKQAQAVQ
jgi:pimeloyl-ACP methyl ester carboxylesterase